MNIVHEIFIKYVRTKMMFSLRFRGEGDFLKPVHIPAKEIGDRFFPFPKYNKKDELKYLQEAGELSVIEKGKAFFYEALKPGGFDLNLLPLPILPKDVVTQTMLINIKRVSLPVNSQSTPYFELFLKYKDVKPELFFKVDRFCGRVHTPISNLQRTYRPALLIDNEKTESLDVVTMQPLLLGKLLFNAIGKNEYSTWINSGVDIYVKLQERAGLATRDEAKKKFFEILFSKPSAELAELFGNSNWIDWINNYKHFEEPLNPHGIVKPHSNLAWLLQSTEVAIMRQVWSELVNNSLPFLSVHDEIIVKHLNYLKAKAVFQRVLSKEFLYFKLNTKENFCIPGPAAESKSFDFINIQSPLAKHEPIPPKTYTKLFSKQFNPLWDIKTLENYFNSLQLPGQPILINQCSTITNVKNYIDTHIEIIKHNNGNIIFAPYYERLTELKEVLKR